MGLKNELIHETSPYLLQHAHNPVHWQPWGEKALQLAKTLQKPILVSIGYSACHWCHVMEKESFENEATAAIMNEHFINIKIDREERPDIDHIYMDAVQAMTGSGGWPLNVFLTPDAKPFFGGTYFPPVKAYNRPSFTDVLLHIHHSWLNENDVIIQQAHTLTNHLKKSNNFIDLKNKIVVDVDKPAFSKQDCINIIQNILSKADTVEGGFGKAPKFPQTFSINCLLQGAYFFYDDKALQQATLSLKKMLYGGIYDQLAGGLCRYSTDDVWLAPHFEKMLYDNALFIVSLGNAYAFTKDDDFKIGIEKTIAFLLNEMKHPEGGFFAALDADSEGVEGKFYVWDEQSFKNTVGEHAEFVAAYFDVTKEGNWEHHNILRVQQPLSIVAQQFDLDFSTATTIINQAKATLLQERSKRVRPGTDDKILLGWNALLVTAFCKAYAVLQNDMYKHEAVTLMAFIEQKFMEKEGTFLHTYKNGVAKYPAFLDDYAYLIEACIALQEITSDQSYLFKAQQYATFVIKNFSDTDSPYFFFTDEQQTDVIVRKIELYDGATPSANAVMAKNLYYLSVVFDRQEWRKKSVEMIESLKTIISTHSNSFGVWAANAINIAAGINEISVIGTNMMPLLKNVLPEYIPNCIIQSTLTNSDMPLFKNRFVFSKTFIYLCRYFICEKPFSNTSELFNEGRLRAFNNI
ncbi:thioredoxin domain-containing protein [Ferruginibacter yonginensis]|uniref:Thioredoxin domain-containing protein n=1 Tax=Ferruginibacter yonginensis TaxID=1310416 RepID=A0ABV8QQD7_9BACT